MNYLFITLVALAYLVFCILGAFLFQLANKLFKVPGITYIRALSILLTFIVIQGLFKWLSALAPNLSRFPELLGFILAIASSYYLYKKYSSAGIGKFILVGLSSVIVGTLVAVISVVLIRLYIAQPFTVSGDSMAPAYPDSTYLILEEWDRSAHKGDVVIVRSATNTTYVIARVTGVSGDTVSGTQVPVGEIYLSKDNPTATQIPGLVPESTIVGKPILNLGVMGL